MLHCRFELGKNRPLTAPSPRCGARQRPFFARPPHLARRSHPLCATRCGVRSNAVPPFRKSPSRGARSSRLHARHLRLSARRFPFRRLQAAHFAPKHRHHRRHARRCDSRRTDFAPTRARQHHTTARMPHDHRLSRLQSPRFYARRRTLFYPDRRPSPTNRPLVALQSQRLSLAPHGKPSVAP